MEKNYDRRLRQTLFPVRVVKTFGNVLNHEALLKEKPLQIGLNEPDCTVFENGETGENAAVLLDFGREINGCVRILTFSSHSDKPASVNITCGESVSEALSAPGEKNSTNDHAVRSADRLLPSYSDMTFNETGFRFVCLRLNGKGTRLSVRSVAAVSVYGDIPYIGSFSCSDETLNKIYDTAAYTCGLCLQNYIWDGIKRDRLVWVGDMHPEMLTVRSVFGSIPLMEKTLEYIKEATPLPGWMNNMPTYSFWWLIIVRDWYFYTGSTEFLNKNAEYIISLSERISSLVSQGGSDSIGYYFLDWQTNGTEAAKYGSRALLAMALDAAGELCGYLGNGSAAALCKEKADILKKSEWKHCGAKQTAAMAAMADCTDKNAAAELILKNGAEGFSTFMSYYLLKTAAEKDISAALGILKEYYGAMLKLGATTFWEDFDIAWAENASAIDEIPEDGKTDIHGDNGAFCYKGFRHSLCHGWSSAPTAFLAEEVLGIRISEPGCKKIRIAPRLGNLEWAKGKYPTPYGTVTVSCKNLGGEIKTEWTAPPEITVITE